MGKLCTVLSKALLFSMKRLSTVIIMVFLFWLAHASENSLRVNPVFPSAAYFPSSHVMKLSGLIYVPLLWDINMNAREEDIELALGKICLTVS